MNLQDTKKLIDSIINNEFMHISNTQEFEDLKEDKELENRSKKASELFDKLLETMPEYRELLNEYNDAAGSFELAYVQYYFKKV